MKTWDNGNRFPFEYEMSLMTLEWKDDLQAWMLTYMERGRVQRATFNVHEKVRLFRDATSARLCCRWN